MANNDMKFMVEDGTLIFKNFGGKIDKFNTTGKRQFAVILEPEVAKAMAADGWNVKQLNVREDDAEEGIEGEFYIGVEARFDIRPPLVTLVTSKGDTVLNEQTVEVLDYTDIATVDLICTAYEWEAAGKSGIKAYLKTMYVTADEDYLMRKYASMGPGEDSDA